MNKISIASAALVSALVLFAVSVAPAMAATPSTPYMIQGYVFYEGGGKCNGPVVEINNMNTSNNWSTDTEIKTNVSYNYYELVLANGTEVNASEILRFEVTSPDGSQANVTEHTVTLGEVNNGGLFDFNITLQTPPKMPDLVISDKSETLAVDGTFTVTYTVTNIGGGNAGASTTSITTSDGQSASDSVPAVAAGDSYTSTVSGFNCTCDTTITVTVCADFRSVVDESNETNNCLSNELVCPVYKPDLVITNVWFELLREGKKANSYYIWYNITNNGDAEAGRSVSNLTVDGNLTRKRDGVKPLAAGETRTEYFRYRSATPPNAIMVCADYDNNIEESDETNNCYP